MLASEDGIPRLPEIYSLMLAILSILRFALLGGHSRMVHRQSALAGFYRCLKPGGKLAVLELTTPET